jgi:hypothetical protein
VPPQTRRAAFFTQRRRQYFGGTMNRKEVLNNLLNKLSEHFVFEIRDELEVFLQEDSDDYTVQLQEAISQKLDDIPFPYQDFESFLYNFKENNPTDQVGYKDLFSRIYGE